MANQRNGSLYHRLTPAQRDTLCEWIVGEAIGFKAAVPRCQAEFGIKTSVGAIHNFIEKNSFAWKIDQAKEKGDLLRDALPADHDERRRRMLAQRAFEAVYQELSVKEIIELRKLEIDERLAALKEKIEPAKVSIQKRRVSLLEEQAAKAKDALNKVVSRGGLTPETLKQIEEAASLL